MDDVSSLSRLRVLHLIVTLGEGNGQYNEHCLPLIGVRDLSICTYFEPQLTPPAEISLFPGNGSILGFFRALRRALDATEYDVIHAHAPHTGAFIVLATLAWLRFGRLRSRMVYTVQDSFYDYKPRNQAMMLVALAAFKQIVFCSRAAYDSLPRPWKWLVRGRWQVVQNAADMDRIDRALETTSPTRGEGPFTVVAVGRLEAVKDPASMLRAFDRVTDRDSQLVIVGAGSREAEVRDEIAALGLSERVTLTGLVPRDEVFVRCADADLMVSTSRGEGLPVAVIEAMASGCPVVLSDIPPHRELADGADFIPLVTVGDVDGFAREINRVRDMSPADRSELGHKSREHVLARYSLPIMHQGIERVYQKISGLADTSARS